MYSSDNFYMGTEASWEDAEEPEREADYVSDSGSAYWYTEGGVFRKSNHWGYEVASCDWFLGDDESSWEDSHGIRCGFCPWDGFKAKGYEFTVYNVPDEIATDHDFSGRPFAVFTMDDTNAAGGYVHAFGKSAKFKWDTFTFIEL